MGNKTLFTGCFAAALTLTGCYSGADTEDADFRHGGHKEFWEIGLGNPANGDTQVSSGDSVSPFELIWDIDGGTTTQSAPDPGSSVPVTTVTRTTADDEILDGSGNVLCTAVESQHGSRRAYQLLDANGNAVLTLWHRYVFAGDVNIPKKGWKLGKLIKHHTAFSFHHNRIHVGTWWNGDVAATADVKIANANPMRKLELASLVAGECGSQL